jgi:holo-[acyl-carrier protein] synthase
MQQIVAHGVDLVRCDRIERLLQHHGDRFLTRVFTPAEIRYCLACRTPSIRLAGRFAVKEAVFKALGSGWRGNLRWTDVETLADPLGKPIVTLRGGASQVAVSQGISIMLVSISHTREHAIASVIAIGGP